MRRRDSVQLSREAAWLGGGPRARPTSGWTALLTLPWPGQGGVLPEPEGADSHREKSCPAPFPDGSILMRIRTPNLHTLIGPKGAVLIGQNADALIGQCRC